MCRNNDEDAGDEQLEFASRAEQQFASSFLLERMRSEFLQLKGIQAPPPDAFAAAWSAFAEDLEKNKELSEGLSAVLIRALRKAIATGESLNKLLGLNKLPGRSPSDLNENERLAIDVIGRMVKGQTFENAIAQVSDASNKSDETVRSIYKKSADMAYIVKLIEMRYFHQNFSEEDFRRFDRLLRLREQKQGK